MTILMAGLAIQPIYGAPKNGDKEKGHNKGGIGQKIGQTKEHKEHPSHPVNKGQIKKLQRFLNSDENKQQLLFKGTHLLGELDVMDYEIPAGAEESEILQNLQEALNQLERSRWSYNPQDERGQGNMGKVDMLAPYGHDKDSDRMELYGNRGRVIRVSEPIPEQPPQEEPLPPEEPIPPEEPLPEPPPPEEEPPPPEEPTPPQEPPNLPF